MESMHQNPQEQALASFEQPDGVAMYVRWSTADQGDGTTLEVQLEACRKLCTGHGWTVPEELIFVDAGESGGNLSRPALDRLRAAVRKGTVRRVIVYRLDRLTRDTPDFNRLVRDEWNDAKTCEVISTVEGQIDVENPTTLLSANIFVGFAEYERLVIRARTYSGKQKRAAAGLNPGISIPPYGYWHGEHQGTFAHLESEAAIVRRVFQEYVSGKGFSSICSGLNADGILSRFGKPWDVSVIKNMV
ncbi:MAG TPA: recombinase family protein, partial [Symbiobacteriaceae bacterium]|nr:recombinase family protein [Symbiobacteriaceae bacterium]